MWTEARLGLDAGEETEITDFLWTRKSVIHKLNVKYGSCNKTNHTTCLCLDLHWTSTFVTSYSITFYSWHIIRLWAIYWYICQQKFISEFYAFYLGVYEWNCTKGSDSLLSCTGIYLIKLGVEFIMGLFAAWLKELYPEMYPETQVSEPVLYFCTGATAYLLYLTWQNIL